MEELIESGKEIPYYFVHSLELGTYFENNSLINQAKPVSSKIAFVNKWVKNDTLSYYKIAIKFKIKSYNDLKLNREEINYHNGKSYKLTLDNKVIGIYPLLINNDIELIEFEILP